MARAFLRGVEGVLLVAGMAALSYCGFVLGDAWMFGRASLKQLPLIAESAGPTAKVSQPARPAGLIGRIDIPRLGLSVAVAEGVATRVLRRSAGHIPGTALPGEEGNTAISAHRDTFFRPLRDIRQDDVIDFTTPEGTFHYRVISIRIVNPSDLTVLEPSVNQVLTLVTCYPFYFVGSAPDRFIVRAERFDATT